MARAPAYDEHQAQCEACGILVSRATRRVRERGSTPPRWRCGDCHVLLVKRVPASAFKLEVLVRERHACPRCDSRIVFVDMNRDKAWCGSCGTAWRPTR